MNVIKNIKLRKTLVWTLKLLLFIGVLYFFVQQVLKIDFNLFKSLEIEHPVFLGLVIFLLPLNWGAELFKWHCILKTTSIKWSIKQLLYSLFSGITTGIVTPNRIGNFIGRMLFFKGATRGQIILGTLYSNFAQFLVTLAFGCISLFVLHDIVLETYGEVIINSALVFTIAGFILYFIVGYVSATSFRLLKRKRNVIAKFQRYAKNLVFPLLTFSAVRYLVFSIQFLLMLMAFGITPSLNIYAGILLLYLISTLTPSLIFGKLLVRETAALLVLSFFIDNEAIIVVSSLFLWLINLGIPSLIGLVFILRKKSFVNA